MGEPILYAVDEIGLIKSNANIARTLLNELQEQFFNKEMELTTKNAHYFLYERDKMNCYIEAVGEFLFKAYKGAEEALEELTEQQKAITESKTATATGRKEKAV